MNAISDILQPSSLTTVTVTEEKSGKNTVWVARYYCPGSINHGAVGTTGLTRSAIDWQLARSGVVERTKKEKPDAGQSS